MQTIPSGISPSPAPYVRTGTVTLLGTGVAQAVAEPRITAAAVISVTLAAVGANLGEGYVSSITPGVGFSVQSGNGSDASTYRWVILSL